MVRSRPEGFEAEGDSCVARLLLKVLGVLEEIRHNRGSGRKLFEVVRELFPCREREADAVHGLEKIAFIVCRPGNDDQAAAHSREADLVLFRIKSRIEIAGEAVCVVIAQNRNFERSLLNVDRFKRVRVDDILRADKLHQRFRDVEDVHASRPIHAFQVNSIGDALRLIGELRRALDEGGKLHDRALEPGSGRRLEFLRADGDLPAGLFGVDGVCNAFCRELTFSVGLADAAGDARSRDQTVEHQIPFRTNDVMGKELLDSVLAGNAFGFLVLAGETLEFKIEHRQKAHPFPGVLAHKVDFFKKSEIERRDCKGNGNLRVELFNGLTGKGFHESFPEARGSLPGISAAAEEGNQNRRLQINVFGDSFDLHHSLELPNGCGSCAIAIKRNGIEPGFKPGFKVDLVEARESDFHAGDGIGGLFVVHDGGCRAHDHVPRGLAVHFLEQLVRLPAAEIISVVMAPVAVFRGSFLREMPQQIVSEFVAGNVEAAGIRGILRNAECRVGDDLRRKRFDEGLPVVIVEELNYEGGFH